MAKLIRANLKEGYAFLFHYFQQTLGRDASETDVVEMLIYEAANSKNLWSELLHNGRKPLEERIEANLKATP